MGPLRNWAMPAGDLLKHRVELVLNLPSRGTRAFQSLWMSTGTTWKIVFFIRIVGFSEESYWQQTFKLKTCSYDVTRQTVTWPPQPPASGSCVNNDRAVGWWHQECTIPGHPVVENGVDTLDLPREPHVGAQRRRRRRRHRRAFAFTVAWDSRGTLFRVLRSRCLETKSAHQSNVQGYCSIWFQHWVTFRYCFEIPAVFKSAVSNVSSQICNSA